MEREANWNDPFPETFDLNQGSPDSYVDRLASPDNRLSPIEIRWSDHVLDLHDRSIRCTSTPSSCAQTSRGWERNESSSTGNNVQEQSLGDDSKMKFSWYSSSAASSVTGIRPEDGSPGPSSYVGNQVMGRSQNIQNYGSTSFPMDLKENSDHSGLGGGRPLTLYESGRVGTEEIMACCASSHNVGTSLCSSSTSVGNNDAAGPSVGTWGSSCKRKALEGSSGQFYPGGSSNHDKPMENIGQQPVSFRCAASRNLSISSSADHLEQLNSRSCVGTSRVCSGRFTSSSVHGVRNFPSRSSPGHWEPVPLDASRGPSVGHSTLYASQPQSQPISNSNALESMPPVSLPLNLNNTLNEPLVHLNEAGFTHRLPWNESFSSRRGSSSSSSLLYGERGHRAHDEVNLRSSVRNIPEYPPIAPASDTINIFGAQIGQSSTPGTSVSSRNYSSLLINPSSGALSSSATWLPHGNQSSHDRQRLFEDHRIPFPSNRSDSGSQRNPFAPLHPASASSNGRATSGRAQHQLYQRPSSLLMDARGDNINGQDVLAAVEGRHRLIRQVLSAMRRGIPLQDEDYMLIDPFVNGFDELQDQHNDMRLDVDNMSYEELLALEERIGNVNTGLSEEKIMGSMKKRKYDVLKASLATEPCCICREDYVGGDDVGILDCEHEFHPYCIKQWLILKNICPICKKTALEV